ncbi:MAG: hypothetical protein AAGA56_01520 [Myxococcota bacterium]
MNNWRQKLRVGALAAGLLGAGAVSASGCLNRPIEPVEPRTTTTLVERLTQSAVDKIDLLLVIDNSRSMADKQAILALAVPDLANQLINPVCINPDDGTPAPTQPAGPLEECPAGFEREFEPILDIHIGVITSSLGSHGSDTCTGERDITENDRGRLINRSGDGGTVVTYDANNFLAWDPDANNPAKNPPGETDRDNLVDNLTQLVQGAGEVGCGFEATLESWYRFLADPEPYQSVELDGDQARLVGVDEDLLAQRRAFMRPDSLLAIVMLTDENDCSIRDSGIGWLSAQGENPGGSGSFRLWAARPECAEDPNDPCCLSCVLNPGECPVDGAAEAACNYAAGSPPRLTEEEDPLNLRCWEQKRRFGIDFMYDLDRYSNALRSGELPDRRGELVPNPIFTDLDPSDDNSAVRDTGLVFLAGIVGVPWQFIARTTGANGEGDPDLLAGLDSSGEPVGGFQSFDELITNGTWDRILGDPTCYDVGGDNANTSCLPGSPLMIESAATRTAQGLPDASAPLTNPINGHEYTTGTRGDLQYACIFDLQAPVDCTDGMNTTGCDCGTGDPVDNALCFDTATSMFGNTQFRAKAYPGIRHLQVLRDVASQGIVGSICPAQQGSPDSADFGYRPAVGSIVERLKQALGGQCLPRSLTPDIEGNVPCVIIEARRISEGTSCQDVCNAPGRSFIDPEDPAVIAAQNDPTTTDANAPNCFCEINQLTGTDRDACQNDDSDAPVNAETGASVDGWCYVDAATVPRTGNPAIVENCPPTEQRIIRFVNAGQGEGGATLFITCSGE